MKIDFKKVLADYGLEAGDKIKFTNHENFDNDKEFRIIGGKRFYLKSKGIELAMIDNLGLYEWEKVEPKKTVGDMECTDFAFCIGCPLLCVNCINCRARGKNIREVWKKYIERFPQLKPMREYIEKELNKEIE